MKRLILLTLSIIFLLQHSCIADHMVLQQKETENGPDCTKTGTIAGQITGESKSEIPTITEKENTIPIWQERENKLQEIFDRYKLYNTNDGASFGEIVAEGFLHDLKDKNYEALELVVNREYASSIDFEFIGMVDIDSFEIVNKEVMPLTYSYESEEIDYAIYTEYTVEINISDSNTDVFPVGKSEWLLGINEYIAAQPPSMSIWAFTKSKNTERIGLEHLDFITPNRAVWICREFSYWFDVFESIDDINDFMQSRLDGDDIYKPKGLYDKIYHFLVYVNAYEDEPLDTIEKFDEKLKTVLPVKNIDFGFFKNDTWDPTCLIYDDGEHEVFFTAAHGRAWHYTTTELNEYDEESGIYTVVLNYCADAIFLVNAITMKYTLIDNNGDLQLIKTECLYNSEYELASFLS